MLFPLTIYTPSPWGFSVSVLEPEGPEHTLMRTLDWAPAGGGKGIPRALRDMVRAARRSGQAKRRGRTPPPGGARVVRLADLEKHPLDSGDFQLEDMWICEKIQRNLHSSKYRVGPIPPVCGPCVPVPGTLHRGRRAAFGRRCREGPVSLATDPPPGGALLTKRGSNAYGVTRQQIARRGALRSEPQPQRIPRTGNDRGD